MSESDSGRQRWSVVAQVVLGVVGAALVGIIMFAVGIGEVSQSDCNETHVRLVTAAIPLAAIACAGAALFLSVRLRAFLATFAFGCGGLVVVALIGRIICSGD